MKVYAQYYKSEETGNEYRWHTLLQFGSSWNVLGSVVMKNPGSAEPLKRVVDDDILQHLYNICEDEWYQFTSDNTMMNVEKLFCAYYREKEGFPCLNGIIRIFNLINVRDADLESALNKNRKCNFAFSKTVDEDILQLSSPVYLGWGKLGANPIFKADAEKIFAVAIEHMNGKYLHEKYDDNLFYHPQYLMGRGKNHPNSRYLLNAFCQNTTKPIY